MNKQPLSTNHLPSSLRLHVLCFHLHWRNQDECECWSLSNSKKILY
ncbi:hypothetical protein LEMLEM_LOCUS11981 [Lemmus lemmus]